MNTFTAVLLVVAILLGGILLLRWSTQPTMDAIEWREETYTVKSGDSLWTISYDYCPENVDRREWIDAVRELNGMDDSIIQAHQKLTVLAPIK